MPTNDNVPTGRAGRLWLVRRIAVAERGADQLERKIRIVGAEVARHREIADRCRLEWEEHCRSAERWLLRAALVGGHDAARHAWIPPVEITVTWTSTIGVRHPSAAAVAEPAGPDAAAASAALVCAAASFKVAMQAAMDAAVADAACAALEEALLATRRRARILRRRWVPRLRTHLHTLDLALEQAEQEDQTRLRRTIA